MTLSRCVAVWAAVARVGCIYIIYIYYTRVQYVIAASILPIAYRRIAVTIRYWSAMMRYIIFAYINNDAVIYSRSTVLLRRLRFGRHLRARAQLMPRRRVERADEFAEARSGR